jgi:hypothetical protein
MNNRAARIGLNEALFREVNERVQELADEADAGSVLTIVCECGAEHCTEEIQIGRTAYRELRADDAQFAVRSGHEVPDVEEVIARNAGYDVVRKRPGVPQKIAEETA